MDYDKEIEIQRNKVLEANKVLQEGQLQLNRIASEVLRAEGVLRWLEERKAGKEAVLPEVPAEPTQQQSFIVGSGQGAVIERVSFL